MIHLRPLRCHASIFAHICLLLCNCSSASRQHPCNRFSSIQNSLHPSELQLDSPRRPSKVPLSCSIPPNPSSSNQPLRSQAPITWPLSPSYSLVFTTYTTSTPERNYYAALLSLQTKIFANYTTSHTYFIDKETIDYSAYGVTIEIGNFDGELQYELLSQLVGGVGAFLQSRKKCEAEWRLQYLDEDGGRRRLRVISVGSIKKGDGLGMGEV